METKYRVTSTEWTNEENMVVTLADLQKQAEMFVAPIEVVGSRVMCGDEEVAVEVEDTTPTPASETSGSETCVIVGVHTYYSGPDKMRAQCEDDGRDTPIEYDSISDASEAVAELDDTVYHTEHNETGRPSYYIVTLSTWEYISSGRNGDMSNYPWTNSDVHCDCGECQKCFDFMAGEDVAYIYTHCSKQ